jgi:hypothetical protein
MRWTGLVPGIGRAEAYRLFWWVNLRERDQLGEPDIGLKRTLIRNLRKYDVGVWTGSS